MWRFLFFFKKKKQAWRHKKGKSNYGTAHCLIMKTIFDSWISVRNIMHWMKGLQSEGPFR